MPPRSAARPDAGVTLRPGPDPAGFARLAEECGFDYLACGEHLSFHGPTANAFISLSVAGGATTSIKLVSSVTLLPLYPPALAAKLACSLDVASGGRFTLGVGVGGEFPREFEASGVDVRQRGARTDEALEILHRLMTEDAVSVAGRFTSFSELSIAPKPVQRPRIPFWIAGRKDAAQRRAARFGDAWMPYMCTPEHVSGGIRAIDTFARDGGRGGWTGGTVLYIFTAVGPDGAAARRMAAERVGMTYRQDFTTLADKYLLAGTPAQCTARLREYLDAGVDTVIFRLACPGDEAETMLRRVADDILPALR